MKSIQTNLIRRQHVNLDPAVWSNGYVIKYAIPMMGKEAVLGHCARIDEWKEVISLFL